MAEEKCACCDRKWAVQLNSPRGVLRLCSGCAAYAVEQRDRNLPGWTRILNRVFARKQGNNVSSVSTETVGVRA